MEMVRRPQCRLPTYTSGNSYLAGRFICVLGIQAGNVFAISNLLRAALVESGVITKQEVRKSISSKVSRERPRAIFVIAAQSVVLRMNELATEGKVVLVVNPIDIVCRLAGIHVKKTGGARAATHTGRAAKIAAYVYQNKIGHRRVHVY